MSHFMYPTLITRNPVQWVHRYFECEVPRHIVQWYQLHVVLSEPGIAEIRRLRPGEVGVDCSRAKLYAHPQGATADSDTNHIVLRYSSTGYLVAYDGDQPRIRCLHPGDIGFSLMTGVLHSGPAAAAERHLIVEHPLIRHISENRDGIMNPTSPATWKKRTRVVSTCNRKTQTMKFPTKQMRAAVEAFWTRLTVQRGVFYQNATKDYRTNRTTEALIDGDRQLALLLLLMNMTSRQSPASWGRKLEQIARKVDPIVTSCVIDAGSEYRQRRAAEAMATGDRQLAAVLLALDLVDETVSDNDPV